MRFSLRSGAAAGLVLLAAATPALGALVGYGIEPFAPLCAFSCNRALSSLMLSCSMEMDMSGMMMDMGSGMTSPQCRAENDPWLETLAWCMQDRCAMEAQAPTVSQLESFWEQQCTGDPTVLAKWSYSKTVLGIQQPPTMELNATAEWLNETMLVNSEMYLGQYDAMYAVQRENEVESTYGIVLLVVGFGTPIVLTWLGYVPYMSGLLEKIKPFVVYPSTVGTYSVRPLPWLLGNAPTLGQGFYVFMFFALNVILCAVNYEYRQPHAWFPTLQKEVIAYVFYRTGTFALFLAPLVILFSSRNNFLLWATNWSHSTYLVLHRWIARIFGLHVLLHTLLALPLYYDKDNAENWWIWGAVATVATMIMMVASGLYVRTWSYEVFLITHVVLAVLVLVGSWYHIYYWIGLTWGYETGIYAACAVWFFDRLFRVGRILKNGVRRASVTDLGGGYVRVDISGLRWGSAPGKHVYAYFPTLDLTRPWENHPFSIIPTALVESQPVRGVTAAAVAGSSSSASSRTPSSDDVEKHNVSTTVRPSPDTHGHRTTAGLTLFIKKSTGITRHFRAQSQLMTLLDGPYPNNPTREILRCDRVLLIGGGIGITGLLPWTVNHSNVKLAWSVRANAECLVEAVANPLSAVAEKDIRVGQRLDVDALLEEEVRLGWKQVGVVVSGPGGLCDDVRAKVALMGRRKGGPTFVLEVDAYSW